MQMLSIWSGPEFVMWERVNRKFICYATTVVKGLNFEKKTFQMNTILAIM